MRMYHIFFIHLFVDECLVFYVLFFFHFYILTVVNGSTINIEILKSLLDVNLNYFE